MKKLSVKIISIALAICLLIGVAPMSIFAEEGDNNVCVDVTLEADKTDYADGDSIVFNGAIANSSSKDCDADVEISLYATPSIKLDTKSLKINALAAGESHDLTVEATANRIHFGFKFIQTVYDIITGYMYTVVLELVSLLSSNYECVRVYIDGVPAAIMYKVDSSVVLNDNESNDGSTYSVSFDLNYENAPNSPVTQNVKAGNLAYEPQIEREGYQLIGWYTSKTDFSEIFDFSQEINNNFRLYAKWFNENDNLDSDNDGLTDSLEIQFGSNPSNSDTDNDGVDDYNELNWLNSNPSANDSNNDGDNDGIDDADNDGLSNAEESSLGTNPAYEDSDYDFLSDYDETNIYKTNPLVADTDGDGVVDGTEVSNGSNPLTAETEFSTEATAGIVNESNSVAASAVVTTDNNGAGTLEIKEVTNTDNALISSSIPGYMGSAYDFSTDGSFESATLTFTYDTSLGTIGENFQPRIYYVNEETGEFEELPNQIVEEGKVSAVVEHFSTYILLNKIDFESVWDKDIKPVDYEGDGKTGIDIVFVVDSSGSMDWNDGSNIRHLAVKNFIDKLGENDRGAVVDFDSYSTVYQNFTSDHDLLYSAIGRVDSSGGTNLSKGMSSAINLFTNSDYSRTDAYKYIVFLTDGDGSYSTSYTTSAANNNIVVYTVGLGSEVQENVLKNIAEGTGGKYYFASSANQLPDIYSDVSFETVDYTTDSNNDGISDYYTNLLNNGNLLISSGSYALVGVTDKYGIDCADWDNDGLLNGEEIQVVTSSYGTYINMKSNPVVVDTDGDEYDDYQEIKINNTNPLKPTKTGGYSIDALMDDDMYVYVEQVNEKSVANSIAGFFDWQKTDESKETFINYFYDYASETSINNNAKEIEKLAKREKAWEIVETVVSFVKLGKSVVDLGTDLGSYDSVVKGQITRYNNEHKTALDLYNKKDYDSIIKKYGTPSEMKDSFDVLNNVFETQKGSAAIDKVNSAVSVVSSTVSLISYLDKVKLPMGDKLNEFSRKYQTWLGKRPTGDISIGTTISVVCDAVDLVTDIADLTNLYGKLQANSEAFNDYIELIDYVSTHGNNLDYVKVAAGDIVKIILDKSNSEYYKQLNTAVGKTTAKTFVNVAITVVGDFCPYVKVAKIIIDVVEVAISLTGMTAYAKSLVKSQCIDAISDGCKYYLNGLFEIEGVWYSYNAEDSEKIDMYLAQLAQSRIVGEDSICSYLKQWSLGNWLSKIITGSSNKEIEENFSIIISGIYSRAENLNLVLSKKLPRYPSDYTVSSGNGVHGGGGGSW